MDEAGAAGRGGSVIQASAGDAEGRSGQAEALFRGAPEIQEAKLGANSLAVILAPYEIGRCVEEGRDQLRLNRMRNSSHSLFFVSFIGVESRPKNIVCQLVLFWRQIFDRHMQHICFGSYWRCRGHVGWWRSFS